MPLAVVNYKPSKFSDWDMKRLTIALPKIIAPALHVESNPEAHLTPDDIEVWASSSGPYDKMGPYDLCVFIFANEYPERIPLLNDAATHIAGELRELLMRLHLVGEKSVRAWVWPLLGKASFV